MRPMKNQYFGDLADYRKYGLLRALAGAGLSVGVCWMLTPNDGGAHGRKAGYLRRPGWEKWARCDPSLFHFLRRRRESGKLHIREAEKESRANGEFPDFGFYSRPFCGKRRREYFAEARQRLRGRDVVFLDPDKGLRPRSALEDAHLDWADAEEIFAAGHSLALTQFPRWSAPEENLAAMAEKRAELARRLKAEVRIAHFCDHPWLFFLAAVQSRHADAFCRATNRLRRHWREPKSRAKVYAPDDIRETVRELQAARRARDRQN